MLMAGYSYNYWTEDSQVPFVVGCLGATQRYYFRNSWDMWLVCRNQMVMIQKWGTKFKMDAPMLVFFFDIQLGASTFLNHVHTMQMGGPVFIVGLFPWWHHARLTMKVRNLEWLECVSWFLCKFGSCRAVSHWFRCLGWGSVSAGYCTGVVICCYASKMISPGEMDRELAHFYPFLHVWPAENGWKCCAMPGLSAQRFA